MTARRLLFLAAAIACAASSSGESRAADAPPLRLAALTEIASVAQLWPGETPPLAAPSRPVVRAFAPGLPQDGGTNLLGLLRDPRPDAPTPAGLRLADPAWMRQAPDQRR